MASQGHPKPGRAPNGCYWDPHHEPSGAWRRKSDNEIHDKAEAAAARKQRNAAHKHLRTTAADKRRHAEQQARSHAAAVAARRNTRYMAARCNDTLFQPGNIEKLARVDVGTLGGTAGKEKCAHCGALLYGDEAVDSKWLVGRKRGRHCCSTARACRRPTARAASSCSRSCRLRDANSYVKDFVSAGEIFSTEEVTDAQFVIDPTAAPKDEHARKYNDFDAFNEVSVMAVEPKGGQAPKRSIVVRARDG